MKNKKLYIIFTLALLFLLFSTQILAKNPMSNLNSDLETNRKLWQSQQINHYQFTYQKSIFAPPPANTPLKVTINNDKIIKAIDLQTNQPIKNAPADFYKSINQLFQVIDDAINRNADEINVTYDTKLGYPTRIAIDYLKIRADDEVTYTVSDLVVISQ